MKTVYEWETPQAFFDYLNEEFNFDIDVCANEHNKKISNYIQPKQNALLISWKGICWMNPPYDRKIGQWMEKAYNESQQGNTVVCLIQGRSSDTVWWHNYVMRSSEIRYIKNRLHFGLNGNFNRANISSVVVIFKPYCKGPPMVSSINTNGHRQNCCCPLCMPHRSCF